MKKFNSLVVCILAGVLASCSPKVSTYMTRSYPAQVDYDNMVVLKDNGPLPDDAQWIGSIEVNGKGSYDRLAEISRYNAWKEGGKYIRIKEFASQGARSDVHVMKSDVYRADTVKIDPQNIKTIDQALIPSIISTPTYVPLGPTPYDKQDHVRVFVGYGRRLNKINPDLSFFEKEHMKRLMNGVLYGIEYIQYFSKSKTSGVGLRYQNMHAKSSDPASMTEGGTTVNGLLVEKVNINFLGPLYSGRWISQNGKHLLMDNIGAGLILWNDTRTFNDEKLELTGRTFGITGDFNYSYFLSDNITLGAGISYTSGVIKRVTLYDGTQRQSGDLERNDWEGLVHLGVCAQLVYTF
jgi:hypothetical protein